MRVIKSAQFLQQFQDGEVLVTDKTDPDWEPIMKKAAAIVTNRGGRTCHAAIVSRELGLPAVVGTEQGTEVLEDGQIVTVSCAEGDAGVVYEGKLAFEVERTDLQALARPKTQVMMNVGNPDEAFALSFIPNDGVGLAREEFIISNYIKVHPLALLDYERLDDAAVKAEIDRLTAGYADKPGFFVDKLAQGVGDDRGGVLPEGRDRADERLQDERVREPRRRPRVRAGGGEPDDRVPRRVALLRPALPGRLRARVPGDEEGARRDGPHEREADDPVLPHGRGRARRRGGDGQARPRARRERARGLRDVRDPEQRDPGGAVRARSSTASRSGRTT